MSRFSIIREAEGEALKTLSPNACKLFVAIRYGRRDDQPFTVSCRDFGDWGLSKDQAARGMHELVNAGLLRVIREASFDRKRAARMVEIVHRRDDKGAELQSHQCDTARPHSRTSATEKRLQSHQRDYKPTLQSHQRDTPKESSLTSSVKTKGREDSSSAARPTQDAAMRERWLRIEKAAKAVALSDFAFRNKAGGLEAADFLARKFERGELGALELRAKLAATPEGSAMKAERRPLVMVA